MISLLSSQDADVQYYCTTALSNIAVDGGNRKKLAQTDSRLVQYLIALMDTKSLKVQCQAALALRNLASDGKYIIFCLHNFLVVTDQKSKYNKKTKKQKKRNINWKLFVVKVFLLFYVF